MTTWHDDEPLSEAVWYETVAGQAKTFASQCSEWIAVAGDNNDWTNQIEKGLAAFK